MELISIAVLLFCTVCAILTWGMVFTYFQESYPHYAYPRKWDNITVATLSAIISFLTGPVGLILFFFLSEKCKYGLKFRPISAEKSWKSFGERFPTLSRKDWLR